MPNCRGCFEPLEHVLVDLGMSPLANAFVSDVNAPETFYPLRAYVCEKCFLVQLPALPADTVFTQDYVYFSSVNPGFVEHAERFCERAIDVLGLNEKSHVLEVASNDGYLLGHMVKRGMHVLGVEPCASVANAALEKGVPTAIEFFGMPFARRFVEEYAKADLIVANNVLAHVPDLHDFIGALKACLAPLGFITLEFPHLLNLIEQTQFDTLYHEHFSYLSLAALTPIFRQHGLEVSFIEELPTHGGSLRLWVTHAVAPSSFSAASVDEVLRKEIEHGLMDAQTFDAFRSRVYQCRDDAVRFLIALREQGKRVAGYGAPAKGTTFLNFCGIKSDLLPYLVDSTPAKQGKWLPGCRIPVYAEERIAEDQPDVALCLPWNWAPEIAKRARSLGFKGRMLTAVPSISWVA